MTELKDSGARQEFSTGAVRDVAGGKGRMDLLPMRAIMEVSKLYEAGCLKYGDRNWERGINTHCYVDSMMRHMAKFMLGQNDEPHLVQACWNVLCLLDTLLRIRDGSLTDNIYDLPMPIDSIKLFTDPQPDLPALMMITSLYCGENNNGT
jgi:hypothetical protein